MSHLKPWEKLKKIENVIQQLNNNHNEYIQISQDWDMNPYINSLECKLESLKQRSKLTEEKFKRKEIKIYFFGKISVGKSRVINALLGKDIFVSVQCHSTSCFVHVNKSTNNKYSVKYPKNGMVEVILYDFFSDAKNKIKELSTCHNRNNNNRLNINESIYFSVVCDEESKILKEDIEIVDCPGSGNQDEISNFIKEHSLDADIFIFVLQTTIAEEDQLFFKYQFEHSNKPDIFILINACDQTDSDDEGDNDYSMENIKSQCKEFLRKTCIRNLKYDERIFCISAKEMLEIRAEKIQLDKKDRYYSKKLERLKAFEKFEKHLLDYIDQPEVNKCRRYEKEFKNINNKIDEAFEQFHLEILSLSKESILQKYEVDIINLNELRVKIQIDCENKNKLLNDLLNQIHDVADCDNLHEVNKTIEMRHDNLDNEIRKFGESQNQILNTFINDNKLDTYFDYTHQIDLKKSWNIEMALNHEIKFVNHKTFSKHARWLSFIPLISGIATNVILSEIEKVDAENEKLYQNYLPKLIATLRTQHEDKLKIVNENIEVILEKMHIKINEIERIFKEKPILLNNYWKNVENILQI